MSLPRAFTTITPEQLYPDHIELRVRLSCPAHIRLLQLATALSRDGVTANRFGTLLNGELEIAGLCNFPFRIRRNSMNAPLSAYININPLRFLHESRGDYGDEHSLASGDNWLHSDHVGEYTRRLWRVTEELVSLAPGLLLRLIQNAMHTVTPAAAIEILEVHVMRIEMAVDFQATDPFSCLNAIRIPFRRHFGNGNARYKNADIVEGYSRDGRMFFGNRTADERYKIYAKTNRRVRFECRLKQRALTNLRLQHNFHNTGRSFQAFIGQIAQHITPHFNRVLSETLAASHPNQLSPMEFVSQFCSSFSNSHTALSMLTSLLECGRIPTGPYRSAVARLQRAGLLVNSIERGYRTNSPSCSRAIEALRGASANFSHREASRLPP